MPIRGVGPLLHEPMVVDVGPPPRRPKLGDVIVFRSGGRSLAHRVVAYDAHSVRTASDARPWERERVAADEILGRVEAVWSDASPNARRVDGAVHRLAACTIAIAHPLYTRIVRAWCRGAELLPRFDPRRRERCTLRIVAALRAARCGDAGALGAALSGDPEHLAAVDVRHRCLTIVGEAARSTGAAGALPPALHASIRQARLAALLANTRMHRAVAETVRLLQQNAVPFVLLKGAARVYAERPDAGLHPSNDLDVLVQRGDVERLETFFLARGYRRGEGDDAPEHYRRRHHHAASLFPPSGEFPIEIHHALAPPGALSTATDWDALSAHFMRVTGAAGDVLVLDPYAAALHLGIHAIGLERLRDVALLAALMAELRTNDLAMLRAEVERERCDRVRLDAAFALAARIAGLAWPCAAPTERYLRWAAAREDLPRALRERCDAVEFAHAYPRRGAAWMRCLLPWRPSLGEVWRYPGRVAGRALSNGAAWWFARAMPPLR